MKWTRKKIIEEISKVQKIMDSLTEIGKESRLCAGNIEAAMMALYCARCVLEKELQNL